MIGPVLKIARGVGETARLSHQIDELAAHLAKSPPDRYSGSNRFTMSVTLEAAKELAWLRSDEGQNAPSDEVLIRARESNARLREVYDVEKEALKQEPANKAELVALGLAVKELALEVESIKRSEHWRVLSSYITLGLAIGLLGISFLLFILS